MKDPTAAERPAAFPLLFFISGLALSNVVTDALVATVGALAIAALLLRSGFRGRVRIALLALFFAAGVATGCRESRVRIRERQLELRLAQDEFVTATAPIEGSWHGSAMGYRLSASRFEVNDVAVSRTITIYLAAQPPPLGNQRTIVVRGFLRRWEGDRFSLSCKSPRLLRYEGNATPWHPYWWNRRADQKLGEIVETRPAYARQAALAKALALGRSAELPAELREDYRRGGTYHLLVFSGMQIALAAAVVSFFFRRHGALRLADWALLMLAVVAPFFAGNEPSVSRASGMIGVYAASRLLGRPTPLENLFYVSALARLLFEPSELTEPGFALTYAATGGLLFIGKPLAAKARRRITAALLYGLGAEITTIPLTLYFFHQYVIGASVVTILLSPLLAAMLGVSVLACVLAFASGEAVCLALELLGVMDRIATAVNAFFGAILHLSRMSMAPPAVLVVGSYALFVLLVTLRPRRAPALILLLPVTWSLVVPFALAEVRWPQVEFLDVGQGDAILVRADELAVLVDGGGRHDDLEFGRRVLLPKLLDRGVRTLEAVLLTHPHPDHCEGLRSVFETLSVKQLWISPAHVRQPCAAGLMDLALARGVPVRIIRSGERRRIGATEFEFAIAGTRFKRAMLNNSSVLCRVTAGGRRFLLTGDIEKEAEARLLEQTVGILRADVLKVAHHGSRNSSTGPFVMQVTPRLAVISCGLHNPFGHPHPHALARLASGGVRLWRTDRNGDIKIVVRNAAVLVTTQIDTPRYAP